MPEAVAIALFCTSCGAKLEITPDIERFVCLHCGTHHVVRRGGGIVSLQPLVEGLVRVQQGTDRTAAELAIRRLSEEIAVAVKERQELEEMPYDSVLPPHHDEAANPVAVFFLAVTLFVVFFALGNTGLGLAMLAVVFVLCMGWHSHVKGKRLAAAKVINDADIEVVRSKLVKLQNALVQNRRIVGM